MLQDAQVITTVLPRKVVAEVGPRARQAAWYYMTSHDDAPYMAIHGSPLSPRQHASFSGGSELRNGSTLASRLRDLLDNPGSSKYAFAVFITQVILITVSTVFLCLETFPEYSGESWLWTPCEVIINSIFLFELLVRLAVVESCGAAVRDMWV